MEAVESKRQELGSALVGVPEDELDILWHQVADFLEKPLQRTGMWKDFGVEDLYKLIKSRDMQCWIVVRNERIIVVALTQIFRTPRRKILGIPFVGASKGTMDHWLGHLEELKNFARFHNCEIIRGWGRAGWVKLLQPNAVRVEFDIEV